MGAGLLVGADVDMGDGDGVDSDDGLNVGDGDGVDSDDGLNVGDGVGVDSDDGVGVNSGDGVGSGDGVEPSHSGCAVTSSCTTVPSGVDLVRRMPLTCTGGPCRVTATTPPTACARRVRPSVVTNCHESDPATATRASAAATT